LYITLHSAATECKFITADTHKQKSASPNHQVRTKQKTQND